MSSVNLEKLQAKIAERSQQASDRNKTTIVYIPEGTTKFRPYLDAEGEPFRTGFRHKFGKTAVNCIGPNDCKICKRLKEISEGWDGAWRFHAQEFVLAYVWIFECSDNSNQYMKLNEPVLLMGNSRLANEISLQLKDVDVEELQLIFNPTEPSLMWQLRYDRDKKSLSLGYFNRKATMDPLPESFPPLSQTYFKEGQPPSPEKEREFLMEIERAYQKACVAKGSVSSPMEETIKSEELKEKISATEKTSADGQIIDIQKKIFQDTGKRFPAKTSNDKPPCFGFHDADTDDPDCLLCKVETKCEASSNH